MSFDGATLFQLLPAIHRIRDAEVARSAGTERGPLEELLELVAEQLDVVEENLEQLYDDLFIETCADWVTPYIGDVIGYEPLHGKVPQIASPRAEVAHTIALRRRKGTALVLEQLARDVTGWHARVVEFFQRLATTQYMNHPRLHSHRCPDLRNGEALEWIGTSFESSSRSVDVRRIESGRGKHNIPNIGLFLWRIRSYPHRNTPAVRDSDRRYRVSPLNHDLPLFNDPQAEEEITQIAEPIHVPLPLSRRRLHQNLASYYGERAALGAEVDNHAPSLILTIDGTVIERDQINICNLSDDGPNWAHVPPDGSYAIDPELGRVALPQDASDPASVRVTWHEGFSADLGGGEYERGESFLDTDSFPTVVNVPDDQPDITSALAALTGSGLILIRNSDRYEETPAIAVAANGLIEIRADAGFRPTLVLSAPLTVTGGEASRLILNGLQITGSGIQIPHDPGNMLAGISLAHCTLVPGLALTPDGKPLHPAEAGLIIEIADVNVEATRSILGGIRSDKHGSFTATDSIIDATARTGVAFAAIDGESAGPCLSLQSCTVIGKVYAREFGAVSDCILMAELTIGDTWLAPVRTERKQVGCVRFSYLPITSIVPPRYRCRPASQEEARRLAPAFTSRHYGTPSYCQLSMTTPDLIRRGAEDEGEMGVFHHLYAALREANLRIRLGEYLRVGLAAGIFYES